MDKTESHKKETQDICNKTQAIIECEAVCREMLKCVHQPVAQPKVKKEHLKRRCDDLAYEILVRIPTDNAACPQI